jgi:NDP-sugar pyrophosphorylase family protein
MNDIKLLTEEAMGLRFVAPEFFKPGEDEYRIRDAQIRESGKDPASYRRLMPYEIEALVKNANSCRDWNDFLVSETFSPDLVKNSYFAGRVRIGRLSHEVLEHHDTKVPVGIFNSRIIACDIGDDCAILDCAYLAHYIVGDGCILINNDEIEASGHAKFGSGLVMEGEAEEVRIELDLMNEAGGRSVLPFDGMLPADAYLWARRRGEPALQAAFKRMMETMFDTRRGRYGTIGAHSVLKSNRIMKDVAIGPCAYIKGANKLKNLTINSSDEARTQIGEGVELVNGIVGYGCRVFYGCKAVRFVMCDNSALKYGARLIHSVLGENSTVSCCEILNNLIFPAHEQHHNTSFLIASLVRGQSNMAAGATIGSNHNSRANDGEIEAGRGFWPGLSTSVKHSSRFASYCLLAKGDYRAEIDLPLPFCLVDDDRTRDRLVLAPAWWWSHNLYALLRNEAKFEARDKRASKAMLIEYSPFAPDTAEEIVTALGLLETWMGRAVLMEAGKESAAASPAELRAAGAAALGNPASLPPAEIEAEGVENSSRPTVVRNPARAWKAYREMLLWYAAGTIIDFAGKGGLIGPAAAPQAGSRDAAGTGLHARLASVLAAGRRETAWENLGGQLVPAPDLEEILSRAASGRIPTWLDMHAEYARLAEAYPLEKARHAWAILAWLWAPSAVEAMPRGTGAPRPPELGATALEEALAAFSRLTERVEEDVYRSRKKDYENAFRRATFRTAAEAEAVMGSAERNGFVLKTRKDAAALRAAAAELSAGLRG